jgi:4,5-dihydroxyphthalate decarboxylase
MKRLHLSLACGDYELTRPLAEGIVRPEGIDLTVITGPMPERNWRMSRFEEFDVCEYSLSGYVIGKSQGRTFTGIPVFLHRRFRHSYIFINTLSGIRTPADLAERRVGLREWLATAGVWVRGILKHEYGVPTESIQWFTKDEEDVPQDFSRSRHRVQRLDSARHIDDLLVAGELDAIIYPETLPSIRQRRPEVARLFVDPHAEEIAYYQRTQIFPIMHITVIKDAVLAQHPWVARSLFKAFEEAKQVCYNRMRDPRRFPYAWIMLLGEEQEAILGPDPWIYGVEPNRRVLETFLDYAIEQDLAPRRLSVEELFHPSVLGPIPAY